MLASTAPTSTASPVLDLTDPSILYMNDEEIDDARREIEAHQTCEGPEVRQREDDYFAAVADLLGPPGSLTELFDEGPSWEPVEATR